MLSLGFFFFASALYFTGKDMSEKMKIQLCKLKLIAQIKVIGCTCDTFNQLAFSTCDEMQDKLRVLQYFHGIVNTVAIVSVIAISPSRLLSSDKNSRYWWFLMDLVSFGIPF